MRHFISLLIILSVFKITKAQIINLDKEKLLEFYQSQKYKEAAEYLQSFYPENTRDVKVLTQIAYCYMMSGKLSDAERNYLKINELQPNTIPVLFNLANINSKRGNTTKANFYLLDIIKLDTLNFKAYKQLADYTDSIKLKILYLKKANNLNPIDPDVAYDLATQYRNLKSYMSAYQTLEVAILADTFNLFLQKAQLPIANELKKYKEVIKVGEKLLLNSDDASIMKDVGKAHFYLKNYEKCIFYYKKIEDLGLQNESLLYFLSLSYRALKKYELATFYAKKTIEEGISINTSAYYLLLGGIYETDGKEINATNAYKKGLTFNTNAMIYYRLGLLYDLKLNNKNNALNFYNLYLKSKPSIDEKEQLEYVKSRIRVINQPKSSKINLASPQN